MIYDHPLVGWAYNASPPIIQDTLVSAYGLIQRWERQSPAYTRILSDLQRTESLRRVDLESLQTERLRVLVRHAYENVPFYHRVFVERKLVPSDIRNPADLYKLPVLTKQDVRRFASELRATNVPRHHFRIGRTGGTTGVPLLLVLDRHRILFDHALIQRHWSWAGYRPGDRIVILRGFTLIPPQTRKPVYWRFDWVENKIYLSGFHLSADVMPNYAEKLKQWRPKFIAAYPSSIYTLARYLELADVRIPVNAIFTSSEVLTPVERRLIEDRFSCRIWDRYGTGERLVVTQQCEYGNYHQNVEFGILHVDSSLGQPASLGETGSLVLTGLTNLSMPLIRYSIEDTGSLLEGACRCGRQLPLAGPVEGRKDDIIVTPEGRLMPRAGLDQIHEFSQNIERCQIVQRKIGEVIIRVQARPEFNESDSAELVQQLRRRIGDSTLIRVERVEKLELTATGKQRFIVSEVDIGATPSGGRNPV